MQGIHWKIKGNYDKIVILLVMSGGKNRVLEALALGLPAGRI